MYVDLVLNLALLIAISVISGFIAQRWPARTRFGGIAQGTLFGATAVLGMLRPLTLQPGLFFDGRSVVISLCALFFGPLAAALAGVITIGYRVWLGGVGTLMGALVVVSSALIGSLVHRHRQGEASPPSALTLYLFGLAVHAAMLVMLLAMPARDAWSAFLRIAPPVMLLYPLATILAGRILADQQSAARSLDAVRESEERLRLALAAADQGLYDLNVQTGEAVVSPEYARMLGYDPARFHETNAAWRERLHPDDLGPVSQVYEDYVAGRLDEYRVEFRQRTRHGGWKWILSLGKLVSRSADGRPLRMLGTHTDITARKQAEAELQLQSAALNAAANAIVITDRDGTIVWVNPAFTALSGYPPEEAIGQNPRTLLKSGVHDPSLYADLWQTLLAGKVWSGEMTNRRRDGSRYIEEQTITPVKDSRGEITHFIAIKRDLTRQHELEAQFLQAQKMETVGRLAGGVAHDFNNLLTVINGTAELVSMQLRENDPLQADVLQIRSAGERAASLTRQLLAFSRKQIVNPAIFDLHEVVADMQPMLRRLIGEDIELLVRSSPGVAVQADPGHVEQLMMNLVVNARDAMPMGGRLTIDVQGVEVDEAQASAQASMRPGRYVRLAVGDTGVGMDEAARLRIFEPFFTTKPAGHGTGLGLATVYGIVKQSGGTIGVSSEPGTGTTFTIWLPRVEATASTVRRKATALVRGAETILVVEDEEALLQLATRILRQAGYTVLTASTGESALPLLQGHAGPIDLMLTDVVLPGISGRELADRAASARPGIRVLFTSGYTDDAILRRGLSNNASQFLGKPYTVDELTRQVREVLHAPPGAAGDGDGPLRGARPGPDAAALPVPTPPPLPPA
jgi:PAS domain S-box-containing protein